MSTQGRENKNYPLFNRPEQYLEFREKKGFYRFFKRYFEWRSLDRCFKGVDDVESVCDCPCGPGRLFDYWKKKGCRLTGVDYSKPMVEASRKLVKEENDSVYYYDAFKLHETGLERPDLVASVRFVYYFKRELRVQLLKVFSEFSRKYVLVQYKTSKTRRGRKNYERSKDKKDSKYFNTYRQIIEELNEAGLSCIRIVPKGDSSDRVFVLAEKGGQGTNGPLDTKNYVYNFRLEWLRTAAAVVLACVVLSGAWSYFADSHEKAVEQVVENYQDGNDTFYVNSDSELEDLRVNSRVVVVNDLASNIEKIVKGRQGRDFYFLIPAEDYRFIQHKLRILDMQMLKSIKVGDGLMSLLTTERHSFPAAG